MQQVAVADTLRERRGGQLDYRPATEVRPGNHHGAYSGGAYSNYSPASPWSSSSSVSSDMSSVGMSSPTSADPGLNVNSSFKYHDQLYSGDESKYTKHRFNRRDNLVAQIQKKISLKTVGAILLAFLTFTSIHAHRTKSTLIVDNAGLREMISIQHEASQSLNKEVSDYKSEIRKLKSEIRTATDMEGQLKELRYERDTLIVQRDDMKQKLEQALMQLKGHVSKEHAQKDEMAHAEVQQIIGSITNTLSEVHHAPEIERDPKVRVRTGSLNVSHSCCQFLFSIYIENRSNAFKMSISWPCSFIYLLRRTAHYL